jgi:release factor glutamine methyltransferase
MMSPDTLTAAAPRLATPPAPTTLAPVATAQDTLAAALQRGQRALSAHSDSPRLDAEILLGTVLNLSRAALIVRGSDTVDAESLRAYDQLLARRAHGEPVAYLTGQREFWSLVLDVTADVLVPRPETEMLVELALALMPADAARTVLDLGTGSGAIALALASERRQARITGVDVSAPALAVARANAHKLGLTAIDWRLGSWFDAVAGARFDVIVANPPYVASSDPALARLASEPLLALTSGPTGLESLRAIVAGAPRHLQPGGWLLLEHGNTQADDVASLLSQGGFQAIRSHSDHAGHARVTLGTLAASRLSFLNID